MELIAADEVDLVEAEVVDVGAADQEAEDVAAVGEEDSKLAQRRILEITGIPDSMLLSSVENKAT